MKGERDRERMKSYSGLLEGVPPCRRRTSELRESESHTPPNLRGRVGEPPEGGTTPTRGGVLRTTLGGEGGGPRMT